jgi:glutaminyl-tRNA synthetase
VVTIEQISAAVKAILSSKKEDFDKKGWSMQGLVLGAIKQELRWANSMSVKDEVERQMLELLGPKGAVQKVHSFLSIDSPMSH